MFHLFWKPNLMHADSYMSFLKYYFHKSGIDVMSK